MCETSGRTLFTENVKWGKGVLIITKHHIFNIPLAIDTEQIISTPFWPQERVTF